MAKFIITRINTYDVANEVYFASELEDAVALRDDLQAKDNVYEWVVAECFDEKKSLVKLLFKLARRVNAG